MWATEETGIATLLAEPLFHLLDFGVHEKDICTIRVTSLLSISACCWDIVLNQA